MTTTYHMTIDIAWALGLPDRDLAHLLKDAQGRPASAQEARSFLMARLREGYDVLPVCDHHDATGACLGHQGEAG